MRKKGLAWNRGVAARYFFFGNYSQEMCGRWGEVVVGEYEIQQRKNIVWRKKSARTYLTRGTGRVGWMVREKKTFLQVSVWHIFFLLLLLISRHWWLGGIDVYSTVVQKKSRKNTSKGLGEERRFFHISSWSNSVCASLFLFVWEIYAFQVCTKELSGCFGEAMALFVLRLKKPVWETAPACAFWMVMMMSWRWRNSA